MTQRPAPRRNSSRSLPALLATSLTATTILGLVGFPTAVALAATVTCPAPLPPPAAAAIIANYSGNSVQSILDDGEPAGDQRSPGQGTRPYAVAITPDGKTAWLADRGTGSVDPYDIASGTFGVRVPVGGSPLAVAISPDGSTLYTVDSTGNRLVPVSLVGSNADTALTAIDLGNNAHPDGVAVSTDGTQVFVAEFGAGAIASFPTALAKPGLVGSRYSLGGGSQPSAVAVTPDGSTLLVADLEHDTVTPFSTNQLTAGSPVALPAGSMPSAIAIAPDGSRAFLADSGTDAVSVLDLSPGTSASAGSATLESNAVQLATGSRPEALAVSPDGGTLLVADFGTNDVTPIDVTGVVPSASSPVPVGSGPDGLAFRPAQGPVAALKVTAGTVNSPVTFDASTSTGTRRLSYSFDFGDGTPVTTPVTCSTTTHTYASPGDYTGKVTVSDGSGASSTQVFTGQTVSRQGTAGAIASAVAHITAIAASDPPRLIVSAYGDKNVVSLPLTGGASSTGISTSAAPGASAVSPEGRTDYVALPGAGALQAVDLSLSKAASPVNVCNTPTAVGVTPAGDTVVIACGGDGNVVTYSTRQQKVQLSQAVGGSPSGVAITTDGATAWVTQQSADSVTPIAIAGDTPGTAITLASGSLPSAAAVTPDGRTLLVAEQGKDALAVIDLTVAPAAVRAIVALPAGSAPRALAVTPDGATAWVADTNDGELSAVSLGAAPAVVANVNLPGAGSALAHPIAVTVTPDGSTVFAADDTASTLDPVSPAGKPSAAAAKAAIKTGTTPLDVVATPDAAPQASLGVQPGIEGSPSTFDASASTAPSSAIASYTFDFGDASPTQTITEPAAPAQPIAPTVTHVYAKPGTYTATVTETDLDGTSTMPVFTGRTLSLAGAPADAVASRQVVIDPLAPTVTGLDPAVGVLGGGTVVTVKGTDLEGATAVLFGNAPATAVTVDASGTSLTATSPIYDNSGIDNMVDVTVKTPGGTSAVGNPDQFTYLPGVAPVVTSVSPSSAVTGATVTVSGTGFADPGTSTGSTAATTTNVLFGSTPATSFAVDPSGTSLTAVVPAGSGTLDIRVVTDTGGESAVNAGDSFTFLPPPVVTPPAPPAPPAPTPPAPTPPVIPGPVITSLSPTPAVGPAGSTLVVHGANLSPVTTVLFGTVAGGAVRTVPDGTSLLVTVPAGTGTVDVVAFAPTGISPVTLADRFTYGALVQATTAVGSTGVAVLASQAAHPKSVSASSVVIAPDNRPEIAAPAAVLATKLGVPLLLSDRGALDKSTLAELTRVAKKSAPVYAVGYSPYDLGKLTKELRGVGHPLKVLGAPDPTATGLAVAKAMGNPRAVVLAELTNQDSLLVGAATASAKHAVLLLSLHNVVPAGVATYLKTHGSVITVGYASNAPRIGKTVVKATRLTAKDPAALSVAAANALTPHTKLAVLASSADVSGALAGLTLATSKGATLLLTPSRTLSPAVQAFLVKHGAPGRTLGTIGHAGAISPTTLTAARAAWSR